MCVLDCIFSLKITGKQTWLMFIDLCCVLCDDDSAGQISLDKAHFFVHYKNIAFIPLVVDAAVTRKSFRKA